MGGGRKSGLIIIYIYTSIKNVRGCVSAKRLRISKNAEIGVQYFLIIYLFVTDILLYLLQGGRKTAFVENIYPRSRLRERQTASKTNLTFVDFNSNHVNKISRTD